MESRSLFDKKKKKKKKKKPKEAEKPRQALHSAETRRCGSMGTAAIRALRLAHTKLRCAFRCVQVFMVLSDKRTEKQPTHLKSTSNGSVLTGRIGGVYYRHHGGSAASALLRCSGRSATQLAAVGARLRATES